MPATGRLLLQEFFELSSGRAAGFAGPQPIAWVEMEAWAALRGRELSPFEARLLRSLDLEMIGAYARRNKNARA